MLPERPRSSDTRVTVADMLPERPRSSDTLVTVADMLPEGMRSSTAAEYALQQGNQPGGAGAIRVERGVIDRHLEAHRLRVARQRSDQLRKLVEGETVR